MCMDRESVYTSFDQYVDEPEALRELRAIVLEAAPGAGGALYIAGVIVVTAAGNIPLTPTL